MSSSMFNIILPSNTPYTGADFDENKLPEQNRPYKFRIQFPKKLEFDKGHWLCGLKSKKICKFFYLFILRYCLP